MTSQTRKYLLPSFWGQLAQALWIEHSQFAAAGGGQLTKIQIADLDRSIPKIYREPAREEHPEARATQPSQLEQLLTERRVLQVTVVVLVVLEVVEEQHHRPGTKRLLHRFAEQRLRLIGRDASRPGKPQLRSHLFEDGGRRQLAACIEHKDAPPFGLAAFEEARGQRRLADAAEAVDGDQPLLLESPAQAALDLAAADIALFEIADPFDLELPAGGFEGVLHRRGAPLRSHQGTGIAAGGERGDGPFVLQTPSGELDAPGPESRGEIG